MSHWRHRRDNNHHELVERAEEIGAFWLPTGPLDGWVHFRGRWNLVEIKNPDVEGQKGEYTDDQVKLFIKLRERGITWWVWRTDADVFRDLGARVTA